VHNKTQTYRLLPWGWFVAWMLTSVGAAVSDIYNTPSRNIITYIALSAVGWAAAGYFTSRTSKGGSGMAVQMVSWAVAYLVAIPLGLVWMLSRDMAPFLLFVPYFLAGAIGGFASSSRPGVWRFISGILVGLVFFLFSTISFYSGYILLLFYSSVAQRYGISISPSYTFIWILPEALFGLGTGFVLRWILGMTAGEPETVPM
jgi:hypothetical protein